MGSTSGSDDLHAHETSNTVVDMHNQIASGQAVGL